jgi:Putative peptidoglycan binding domain
MTAPTRGRRIAAVIAVLAAIAAVVVVAAVAYDDARERTLAPGISVGGVEVGGLRVAPARQKIAREAVRPLRRTVEVHSAGRTFLLSAGEARVRVDVDGALDRALARTRRGWLGARVVRGLSGARVDEDVPLERSVDRGIVRHFARHVGAEVERDAIEADVEPHPDGLEVTESRTGRRLDSTALARRVRRALTNSRRAATLAAATETVKPKTSLADLREKYASYILIDRKAHQLRLYRHLALDRTYPIAVGKAGLETPGGLYDV